MTSKIIDLGGTNNNQDDFPQEQKLKFTNTGDHEIILKTPKGIKKKGDKDEVRDTKIKPGKTSKRFKITAEPGSYLEYSWDGTESPAEAMRTGRIKVS